MDAAVELAQAERENEKLRADNADLGRRLEQLGIDNADPERQLDWFRRQLFGSKSEKRVEIPPEQMTFRDRLGLEDPKRPEEPEFELAERRKRGKKSFEGAADESGPGFGPDVPVETVAIDNPEAAGIPESERELVGEKVVHRLAQTACTFRIIRCVRQDVEAPRHRRARRRRAASGRPRPKLRRHQLPRRHDGRQVLLASASAPPAPRGWKPPGSGSAARA